MQGKYKTVKRSKQAGVKVTCMLELQAHCMRLLLPPTVSALTSATHGAVSAVADSSSAATLGLFHVPMDVSHYAVEGACLTGKRQIEWIGQLANMPGQFVLHVDGKYKLHHGGWILISVGTHYLRYDDHNKALSHRFAPLMYLLCKQQETSGSASLVMDAINVIR